MFVCICLSFPWELFLFIFNIFNKWLRLNPSTPSTTALNMYIWQLNFYSITHTCSPSLYTSKNGTINIKNILKKNLNLGKNGPIDCVFTIHLPFTYKVSLTIDFVQRGPEPDREEEGTFIIGLKKSSEKKTRKVRTKGGAILHPHGSVWLPWT